MYPVLINEVPAFLNEMEQVSYFIAAESVAGR